LMDFLKGVLVATEECALLKGSRRVVEKRRFGELRSIYDLSRALIFKGRRRMVDKLRKLEASHLLGSTSSRSRDEADTFKLCAGIRASLAPHAPEAGLNRTSTQVFA